MRTCVVVKAEHIRVDEHALVLRKEVRWNVSLPHVYWAYILDFLLPSMMILLLTFELIDV